MESTCSARFLSASTDETECYLYPKRIKIESNAKSVEKEEQQKLEASIHCVSRHQTSPHEPKYFLERQTSQALEKQSCDTARKPCVREFFHFQTCSSDRLLCRGSENKLSTKRLSPENEFQNPAGDVSLNVRGQPLETKSFAVRSAANTCKHLQVLNAPEVQWNNNVEQSDNRNGSNELNQNPSVTPFNSSLFQMELLGRKSVSDKKWEQYQLLQIPFLCGTGSVFSDIRHEKRNFLKKTCSTQDKDCSSSGNETAAKIDNEEKNNSSHIIPILKPFKSIELLEIPNFQLPRISNKINSKTLSTDLKETDWDDFKGQPSLMQSKQIYGMQKISGIGKQRLQNDKSSVKTSTVGSEFKEKNCSSTRKQERSALTEEREVSVTYFRGNSTDIQCYQIFAENDFRDEMMENSDADYDQESKIHFYISTKNVQNKTCVSWDDLLKRMGRKSSDENVGTFHVQTSISVTTEALEKNKLDVPFGAHHSDSDTSLYEAESKLSTKEILDSKRYLTKSIIFESNCPQIIVQDFLHKKVSCNIFRGKEMFKLKSSFQKMLFAWARTWAESFMPPCQDSSVTHWLHFRGTLNGCCDAQELVKSNANRNHNSKIYICLLAVISKDLKVELLKTILPSFFGSTDILLPTKVKSMQVGKHPLCGTKQNQLNSCTDNTLRQNTEFHKESKTYPGFLSSKFVESIGFDLHNECQRRHFSRPLGEKSNFLKRGMLFHNQKSGLCRHRHVRKHHLLSRQTEGFSIYLRSLSHKNGMKKQILVAKCLILLQGTSDHSSLDKMYYCNITKMQYLIGANLRSWSHFPAHSQLKFGKVNSKCTNQEISATAVKQERGKPSKIFNSYFLGERFKTFPLILRENEIQKTTRYRNCIMSTNEVTHTMKKYLDTSSYVNANRKECVKSEELQINSYDFLSKKSLSIFDTYEKIPLFTDSEELDQIPVANQDNSVRKKLSEENAFTSSKEGHNLSAKSNDVIMLSEQSKTTMEKCNFLLLRDSQTNQPEYCKRIDTCSLHLVNKKEKVEDQNTCLHFENLLSSSSNVYHSVALPLDSSSFISENRVVSEDGHCRSSSSADNQKQTEKTQGTVQHPSAGRPTVTDTCLQLQAKGAVQLSSQEHTQRNKAGSLEPATLKQHLEYVKEQEEINDEQMHVTNESQCETVMNDLIMSHSEEESKTFIAAEEKLKMHLSVMNNGYLEDVKDKYVPLENKITCEFELKRKFDLVLEELHMFHEISKGNENSLSSLETNSQNSYYELNSSERRDGNMASVSRKKVCISSPIHGTGEVQNITDSNESSLNEKMPNENEDQKVSKEYCISKLSSEKLLHSPVAEGHFDAAYKKPYAWDPAFLPCTLLKEANYNLLEEGDDVLISSLQGHGLPFFHRYFLQREVLRVQPLKTCKGPIRIGLSRKARPKQLHPYLK